MESQWGLVREAYQPHPGSKWFDYKIIESEHEKTPTISGVKKLHNQLIIHEDVSMHFQSLANEQSQESCRNNSWLEIKASKLFEQLKLVRYTAVAFKSKLPVNRDGSDG